MRSVGDYMAGCERDMWGVLMRYEKWGGLMRYEKCGGLHGRL